MPGGSYMEEYRYLRKLTIIFCFQILENLFCVFQFIVSAECSFELYFRCSKELNQWDHLLEYANSKGNTNPHLVLESAWRVPNWALMKDALSQVQFWASCILLTLLKIASVSRLYLSVKPSDEIHASILQFHSWIGLYSSSNSTFSWIFTNKTSKSSTCIYNSVLNYIANIMNFLLLFITKVETIGLRVLILSTNYSQCVRLCFQVEQSCPKEMAWKVNLYRGYIAICHPDDHHLNMVTMVM